MTRDISRKQFMAGLIASGFCLAPTVSSQAGIRPARRPRAIAMWDFSWLERRWPGAGYENWDKALDELVERGYDAVRIDPYPHLIAENAKKSWLLKPVWNTQDWGAPTFIYVQILPHLYEFIEKCHIRGIKIGLSSWFREDESNIRMQMTTPQRMAEVWSTTLRGIEHAGLLNAILYVDLCNEWPGPIWAPFVNPPLDWGEWSDPRSISWMKATIACIRDMFPDLPLLFSSTGNNSTNWTPETTNFVDMMEHHVWMANLNRNEFNKKIGYNYSRFSDDDYHVMQFKSEKLYKNSPKYWEDILLTGIASLAEISREIGKPLITTECWAVVDYKDWPMLSWEWVKHLCATGTLAASSTGQWLAIATSNFCGPQFQGMWRDIKWHQQLTDKIKAGPIAQANQKGRLWQRL